MNRGYRSVLHRTLRVRWAAIPVYLVVLAAMAWLFLQLKSELSPIEDRGFFMAFVVAPEGSTMQYTDNYMRGVGEILKSVPEIETLFEVVAPGLERPNPVNLGIGFAVLKHWNKRDRKQMQIAQEITPKLYAGLPGVISFAVNSPSLGGSFLSKQIEYVIYGNSYPELQGYVSKIMGRLSQYPGITGLDTDLKLNKTQLRVEINRDKAAALGVSMATIGSTLETLLGGRDVTRYKREGKQYDVVVQMEDDKRRRPDDLTAIYVRSASADLVQLSNLVQLRETVAPKELNHFNKFRAAVINGNVGPGGSLGDVLAQIDKIVAEELPKNVITDLDGQSREFRETGMELYVTLALALIFIYLVLSAQFESFVGPLVIMLTVPLAGIGALLAMYVNAKLGNGGTLNVYSQIGLVMLVGLITKNGILIVEFANQQRRRGLALFDAVVEASTLRLRPILMTTLSTVLGALPLAISAGAGAEARQAIGWVVVGGMALGTLLTLFVIPVFYTLIVRRIHMIPEEREALEAAGGAGPMTVPHDKQR
jgi:multidrug efflux pump